MSSTGTVRIIWANGEDGFCLAKIGLILELEDKCGYIGTVFMRLQNGTYGLNDLREVIRLGLIGGGMAPEAAMKAVKRHVDPDDGNPLAQSVLIAKAVIAAVLVGVPDDPVGKPQAADAKKEAPVSTTTTAASAAPSSSESVAVSAGPPASPTSLHFGKLPPASRDTTVPTPATNLHPSL